MSFRCFRKHINIKYVVLYKERFVQYVQSFVTNSGAHHVVEHGSRDGRGRRQPMIKRPVASCVNLLQAKSPCAETPCRAPALEGNALGGAQPSF